VGDKAVLSAMERALLCTGSMHAKSLLSISTLLVASCTAPTLTSVPPVAAECEGLDAEACLLPWPSSRYLVDDPDTITGYRVAIPPGAMPVNIDGIGVDPQAWNTWDGFSPMSTVLAQLPVRIDATPLVSWRELERSLGDESPTVLLDVTTGERVAHFAEIEESEETAPDLTTLYVRPAARLSEDHDYVVAIRRLTDTAGSPVVPFERFRALRDGDETPDTALEDRRARMEGAVFGPLAAAGVAREELILAWDFHTASGESAWGDLVAMRDDAFAMAGEGGLGCTITETDEAPEDPRLARIVEGTFTVPSYLGDGGRIARDAAGVPVRTGTVEAPFVAAIPVSVADALSAGGEPVRVVAYGHGLFSDRTEALREFMVETADTYPMVVVATDFDGLTGADAISTAAALTELSSFTSVVDTIAQSMIAHLLLPRTFAGACAADDALRIDSSPVADPSQLYYYGNSQGAILGTALAALSPDVERWVLGVGGISYPIMMPRSTHWPLLSGVLSAGYDDALDRQLLMVMFAHQWSRVEGAAFAPHLLRDPLPGSTTTRVLYQVGLNDAQTPNVASEIAARTIGLPQLSSSAREVHGLESVDSAESAFVYFDFGAPELPVGTERPAGDTDTHEALRRDPGAQAQIDAFLRVDGMVVRAVPE